MTRNEKDIHRLMDTLLVEDARDKADEEMLAEVEKALEGGEEAVEITPKGRGRRRQSLAWAAVLLMFAGLTALFVWSNLGRSSREPSMMVLSGEFQKLSELLVEKREKLREVVREAGFPYTLSGPLGLSGEEVFRAAQMQDDDNPAVRCDMILRIEDVLSASDGTPTRLSFTYQLEGQAVTEFFTSAEIGPQEDPGAQSLPFLVESLPNGRNGIAVHLERMADYLTKAGANLEENRSLLVNANHRENERVQIPSIPSVSTDPVLVLRDTRDLTAFSKGFSLLTPFRMYFANDVNLVPASRTPSGDPVHPPLCLLAPERRFGVRELAININFEDQLNYLGKGGSPVRPLDLRSSGLDSVVRSHRSASLGQHSDGTSWDNVSIQGGVFAANSEAEGELSLDRLASRQVGYGMEPTSEAYLAAKRGYVEAVTKLNEMIGARGPDDGDHLQGLLERERYGQLVDQPWKAPWLAPLSTFSVDVDTASYTNIRRMLKDGTRIPKDAVRLEECLNYFDYGYAAPKNGGPFAVHVDLASCPWAETHHLVKIGIKGKEMNNRKRPPSNLVFLIDVSGSMNQANKLPLLVESMKILVEELDERDSVGIVVYAGSAGTVLEPTEVAGEGRTAILTALDRLSAGGSTAGAAGIRGAYELAAKHYRKGGVNRVFLATDGDFNVGTSSQGALVDLVKEKATSGVYLSVLGFGSGNLNDSMMEAITNQGNGNYFYIDSRKEGRKVLLQNLSGTLVTIAKDVKVQVEFNPGKVAAYRLIGYANRLLRDEDFDNDKVDAGDIGAGHTVTALYEVVPVGVEVPRVEPVDPLKYQVPAPRKVVSSRDWMTVKLRYKKPDGDQSSLLEVPVTGDPVDWKSASPDFLFAAAVALFGEKLRGSDQIGGAAWQQVGILAHRGVGEDRHGYRAEFVELAGLAARLHPDPAPEALRAAPVEAPEAE